MANITATAAAVGAALLVALALVAMATGNLQAAGFSFLAASLVIYLRETRLVAD